ncbi:AsmA family protein [Siccirubricoccus deserti]
MRRVAVLLLALLVLLGAGLWFGPRLLDWDVWHDRLTEIASARLGRRVALDGPITLVLLPQPRLEATRIAIGPDADGLTITARSMRLRLDLPALLGGRLEPRELALVGGEISLPWPPTELPSFRPPPWLTTLDARLEDCRLTVGGLQLEGLNARLTTGGLAEALVAEGRFAWRGLAVRFSGDLGRAGFDGIAPLDLSMAVAGTTLTARGVLAPGGGFVGRVEATGTDLSTLVPAPPLAFRATGRLTAAADLLAADDLTLDLGGQPARGAVTLRLAPAPRLDIALAAGRLDLDAWIAALRPASSQSLPVSIDLSAEATSFGPVPLRRLRGAAFLEGERMTLSDVSAVLPGDTEIELTGATARSRLELAIRFAGTNLRETLASFGLPLGGTDPARLRQAEGRFRLALQENEATISDLVASIDGARLSGAGVVRQGCGRRSASASPWTGWTSAGWCRSCPMPRASVPGWAASTSTCGWPPNGCAGGAWRRSAAPWMRRWRTAGWRCGGWRCASARSTSPPPARRSSARRRVSRM